jgi:sulfoxide reductase heme-binding subunit YedZ
MTAWTLPHSTDAPRRQTAAERINGALRRFPPGLIYLAGALWAVWLFWLGATGGLGAEPINALERAYGDAALKLLIAGLAVTPLRRFTGISFLRLRRAIGMTCFFFALAHVLVWALLDLRAPAAVWEDILKRPYVTIGMLGFLALVPLALTSNDRAVRRMGASTWRRLHRLVYPAAVFGALHQMLIIRGFAVEALVQLGLILGLLLLRLPMVGRDLARRG